MFPVLQTANPSRPVRTAVLTASDSKNALLRIKYTDKGKNPSSDTGYCRLTIDANGSGGTKLILFLDIGASSASYDQYQFSAYATAASDPNSIDDSPTHTQCTTLKALIKALNAIDGVFATRLHAPADYSLDTDDFIDLSATRIGPLFTDVLYRDASTSGASTSPFAVRIGVPDDLMGAIKNGNVELISINAYIDGTAAQMKLSQDPNDTDESEEVQLAYSKTITDATWTELWNWHEAPPVYKGPLLLEVWDSAAEAIADAGVVIVEYRSAEY